MLSTPLGDCNMSESSEFTPPMAEPLQLLDCFTTPKAKVQCKYYWYHSGWKIPLLFTV